MNRGERRIEELFKTYHDSHDSNAEYSGAAYDHHQYLKESIANELNTMVGALVLKIDGDIEIRNEYGRVVAHKTYNPNETIEENLIHMFQEWEKLRPEWLKELEK